MAARLAVERVKLPCPLRCPLSHLLLLSRLSLDAPHSLIDGEAAAFVGPSTGLGDSRVGVLGVAVRVDRAHPELVATRLIGPELADQQRQALLLVPPLHLLVACARGFDGASGIGHAGVIFRLPCRCLGCPCRKRLTSVGQLVTPVGAHPRPLRLRLLPRSLVLAAGFAPAEPADSRKSAAGSGFVLDNSKVRRAVLLCLLNERPGDLGADSLGGVLGRADCGGVFLILGAVRVPLGVEACGNRLPPVRRLLGALGLLVEAGEFVGDEPHGAI